VITSRAETKINKLRVRLIRLSSNEKPLKLNPVPTACRWQIEPGWGKWFLKWRMEAIIILCSFT